jgi:hypothetical protein
MQKEQLLFLRKDLSMRGKNGIGFLLAGMTVWLVVAAIFFMPLELRQQNILMLFATGLMFPLSILFTKLIRAEWKFEDSAIADLGIYLNIAQLMYFPIIFFAIANSPEQAVIFFAVITGAHFFPYGWYHDVKAYYIMSPIISVLVIALGWSIASDNLWLIPSAMVISLLVLVLFLSNDYQRKANQSKAA